MLLLLLLSTLYSLLLSTTTQHYLLLPTTTHYNLLPTTYYLLPTTYSYYYYCYHYYDYYYYHYHYHYYYYYDSLLRLTSQRKFRRNFRVTDIQQLFNHHSSYTTHQISWQVQQFVNLHVQISWQVQYKMRFREIADARNAVFFNRTGGFEPGKSSSAERLLRDGLGSCSVGRPF